MRRAARRLARDRARQADGGHGAVRLRQVDPHAHPRRPRQADHGRRSDRGHDITTLGDTQLTKLRRRHIGFVFQFFNLLPMLTAEENIALPLSIAGEKPDRDWFDELLDKVGLADRLAHRPAELSGGQQQRVAIARALVSRPTVVFADEPTGNLDSATSGEILELLRDVGRRLRPDDGDGDARCPRRGDRRPDPLPRRRPDRARSSAALRAARRARGDGGAAARR